MRLGELVARKSALPRRVASSRGPRRPARRALGDDARALAGSAGSGFDGRQRRPAAAESRTRAGGSLSSARNSTNDIRRCQDLRARRPRDGHGGFAERAFRMIRLGRVVGACRRTPRANGNARGGSLPTKLKRLVLRADETGRRAARRARVWQGDENRCNHRSLGAPARRARRAQRRARARTRTAARDVVGVRCAEPGLSAAGRALLPTRATRAIATRAPTSDGRSSVLADPYVTPRCARIVTRATAAMAA